MKLPRGLVRLKINLPGYFYTDLTVLDCRVVTIEVSSYSEYKVKTGLSYIEQFRNMGHNGTCYLCRYQFHPKEPNPSPLPPPPPPRTRLEGSKTFAPRQSLCTKTLPSRQNRESKAPPQGHRVRKSHKCIVSINSDTI